MSRLSPRPARTPRATRPSRSRFAPALDVPAGLSLREHVRQFITSELTGEGHAKADAELERLRKLCREGNPFPLVAYQWPELIVQDEREAAIFRENVKMVESALVTDAIKSACLAPNNPVLRIDWWQHIILAAMFDVAIGEMFIAGATGVGKGASVSIGANLWFDAYTEARIHLTGRDRDHARRNIFGETIKWRTRMKEPGIGSVNSEAISHTARHCVVLLNPDASSSTAGEAFSGAHGKNTFYVFDEATSHPDSFVENARRNAHMIVALANPRTLFGWFRAGFKKVPEGKRIAVIPGDLRMRLCMSIGGADCINVRYHRLKVPVAPKGGIEVTKEHHGYATDSSSPRATEVSPAGQE
jgi:hypothetical protein